MDESKPYYICPRCRDRYPDNELINNDTFKYVCIPCHNELIKLNRIIGALDPDQRLCKGCGQYFDKASKNWAGIVCKKCGRLSGTEPDGNGGYKLTSRRDKHIRRSLKKQGVKRYG